MYQKMYPYQVCGACCIGLLALLKELGLPLEGGAAGARPLQLLLELLSSLCISVSPNMWRIVESDHDDQHFPPISLPPSLHGTTPPVYAGPPLLSSAHCHERCV